MERTFRKLGNYKEMHEGTAKHRKCHKEFMSAKTLTQAKKILWGVKQKDCSGFRGHPEWNERSRRK